MRIDLTPMKYGQQIGFLRKKDSRGSCSEEQFRSGDSEACSLLQLKCTVQVVPNHACASGSFQFRFTVTPCRQGP